MFSAFTPDIRYDTSTIKFIGNVYCRNTMSSDKIACAKRLQAHNIPFEEQTNSFYLKFVQEIYICEGMQKTIL